MYVVNCHKLQLIVGGKAPNIVIENCIGVELLVATQDEEHAVETEKSSGVIISISKLEVPYSILPVRISARDSSGSVSHPSPHTVPPCPCYLEAVPSRLCLLSPPLPPSSLHRLMHHKIHGEDQIRSVQFLRTYPSTDAEEQHETIETIVSCNSSVPSAFPSYLYVPLFAYSHLPPPSPPAG